MNGVNKRPLLLYKKPGNRCLICGKKVETNTSNKGWSWAIHPRFCTIIGVVHDSCDNGHPPDEFGSNPRPQYHI